MSIDASAVRVGDRLPELAIDITPKLIVGGAIASRDYENVHHDTAGAQELGSPDIFMNILTTNGLVGRYITDWAGKRARLRKVAIRLGAPNYPGDRMTLEGEVVDLTPHHEIEIFVRGKNSIGDHVTGTVILTVEKNPLD